MNSGRGITFLAVLLAGRALAAPIDDFRNAVNYSVKQLASPYTITGFANQTGTTADGTDFEIFTKPSGSLTGTADLSALAGSLGLTGTAYMTGVQQSSNVVVWTLTAPSVIGKTVPIDVNGTTVNVKITSVAGTLTGLLTPITPIPDPATGVGRNLLITPLTTGTNQVVVKGTVTVIFPVTYTVNPSNYIGYGGSGVVQSTISGTVNLQSTSASRVGKLVTLVARTASGIAGTYTATLDASGHYSVTTGLYGDYDLDAKVGHWLSMRRVGVSVRTSATADFTLVNGDCNGDDTVDASDYFILSDAYDANLGDAAYNPSADLNEDATVDASDYFILSDAYDRTGPTLP